MTSLTSAASPNLIAASRLVTDDDTHTVLSYWSMRAALFLLTYDSNHSFLLFVSIKSGYKLYDDQLNVFVYTCWFYVASWLF